MLMRHWLSWGPSGLYLFRFPPSRCLFAMFTSVYMYSLSVDCGPKGHYMSPTRRGTRSVLFESPCVTRVLEPFLLFPPPLTLPPPPPFQSRAQLRTDEGSKARRPSTLLQNETNHTTNPRLRPYRLLSRRHKASLDDRRQGLVRHHLRRQILLRSSVSYPGSSPSPPSTRPRPRH